MPVILGSADPSVAMEKQQFVHWCEGTHKIPKPGYGIYKMEARAVLLQCRTISHSAQVGPLRRSYEMRSEAYLVCGLPEAKQGVLVLVLQLGMRNRKSAATLTDAITVSQRQLQVLHLFLYMASDHHNTAHRQRARAD